MGDEGTVYVPALHKWLLQEYRDQALQLGMMIALIDSDSDMCVYYIYNEIRVCPRLGAARADPPLSRIYPQRQCCLGTDLAGTTPLTED